MSYRIEITAASLEELADKALALGGRLLSVRAAPVQVTEAAPAITVTPVTPAPEPVAEAAAPEPEAPAAAPTLDYKSQVAPLVLKLVEVCGKPAAQRVLDQFGAAKASDIAPERWPELIGMINAEMAQ